MSTNVKILLVNKHGVGIIILYKHRESGKNLGIRLYEKKPCYTGCLMKSRILLIAKIGNVALFMKCWTVYLRQFTT